MTKQNENIAVAGDRTRVTRVTGGNTYHYTTTTYYLFFTFKSIYIYDEMEQNLFTVLHSNKSPTYWTRTQSILFVAMMSKVFSVTNGSVLHNLDTHSRFQRRFNLIKMSSDALPPLPENRIVVRCFVHHTVSLFINA